jgi:hypothetical protein
MKRKLISSLVAVCLCLTCSYAQTASQDEPLKILKNKISRGMGLYQKADIPVYLISY